MRRIHSLVSSRSHNGRAAPAISCGVRPFPSSRVGGTSWPPSCLVLELIHSAGVVVCPACCGGSTRCVDDTNPSTLTRLARLATSTQTAITPRRGKKFDVRAIDVGEQAISEPRAHMRRRGRPCLRSKRRCVMMCDDLISDCAARAYPLFFGSTRSPIFFFFYAPHFDLTSCSPLLLCCTTMAYLSLLAALLVCVPAANAFAMSVRTSTMSSAGGGVQRADFLKQVGGAAALATAGIAAAPLASVAAASKCNLRAAGCVIC